MTKTVYWFRRDLRLYDNAGVAQCTGPTAFIFIFTPAQTLKNQLSNDRALHFIFESIIDLAQALNKHGHKLHIFYGEPSQVLTFLTQKYNINTIICGRDYTPYSAARDDSVAKAIAPAQFISIENMTLWPINHIQTTTGGAYAKFTPYYNQTENYIVPKPKRLSLKKSVTRYTIPCEKLSALYKQLLPNFRPSPLTVVGGRTNGLKRLKACARTLNTTKLSAYINRGCLSPAEVYYTLKTPEKKRELIWREFYINLVAANPNILGSTGRMPERWQSTWSSRLPASFTLWCEGKTGFPLIDASMRELNETGFMHNRGRMMCAEFLCKRLFINWEYGERYFAVKLVDYDATLNACNWMWVAFMQPYFRMTNPEHGHKDYLEYITPRLSTTPTFPKVKILTNEQVIERYEKKK